MDFGTDTKTYAYILKEGETSVPKTIQYAFDQAIKGQWIMREHMKVGMTAGQSLDAMVKAMEKAGYIYTPVCFRTRLSAPPNRTKLHSAHRKDNNGRFQS